MTSEDFIRHLQSIKNFKNKKNDTLRSFYITDFKLVPIDVIGTK